MHSVCCCSLPVWRRSFLKKGTPCDLFLPRPGSAPGGIWPKNNNTCKGPWVLHPYQVSSKSIKGFWRRSWKCESLQTDDDGRTDRQTDGRRAMTIAHLSLQLRWAKKSKMSRPIRGWGSHPVFLIGIKKINLAEDIEISLPVKFHWLLFSGFRGEVENVSANQRPRQPSCFSDWPIKHKLGRGHWDLASCQVSLNSIQRFQRRSRKCES